jgi:hypothetical protein
MAGTTLIDFVTVRVSGDYLKSKKKKLSVCWRQQPLTPV